jgi:hypothetical protein
MLSSACAGIVLGSIIACCNIICAKRQRVRATGQQVARALAAEVSNYPSSQADITDVSGAGGLAGFGRIAPGGRGGGGPAPRRPPIFPVTLFAVTIVLAVGWSPLSASHIVRSARRCARHIKGVRIREGLQPTRHSTFALERGTSGTGSEREGHYECKQRSTQSRPRVQV